VHTIKRGMTRQASPKLECRAVLLALSLAALVPAEAIITIKVDSSKALVEAFTTAEANSGELYYIYLAKQLDAAGKPIPYKPSQTLTLTKGMVSLRGSSSGNPANPIMDGGGMRRVLEVNKASGYDGIGLYLEDR
jgi:hypothetical protein